jgi:hypothetical protein
MVIALLVESDAQQVQGVGVVGLGAEHAAVPPDSLGQQAALVFPQANGKLVVHGDVLSTLKGGEGMKDEHKALFLSLNTTPLIVPGLPTVAVGGNDLAVPCGSANRVWGLTVVAGCACQQAADPGMGGHGNFLNENGIICITVRGQ